MDPRETLTAFDAFLGARRVRFEGVVIGGAALNLLGVITRPTKDCDILHPRLTDEVLRAAREFAAENRARGEPLRDDWLNNGPASLVAQLPSGWEERLQDAFAGTSIWLRCLGRLDLLRSKLFALCDRAVDLPDCVALSPTVHEIDAILPWLAAQDLNPEWPEHVRATMQDLLRRCDRGI